MTSVGAGKQDGTWGGKAVNPHEAEQTLDEPLRYQPPLPMRASALGRDLDGTIVAPGLQPPRPYQVPRGLVVLVYGNEADANPVDAHVLEFGEVFDVDGPALRSPAVFTALRNGLRLDDRGGLDRVFVEVRGLGRLRTGQRFRLGELELRYEATSGLMPGVGDTSRPWGRIVVVASPAGSRSLPRPRSVHNLTGVGCGLRFVNGRLEVIDDIDLDDGVCRIVGDLTGVYIESLDAGMAVFKEVLPKDVIELGAVALLENTRIRIEPAEL